MRVLRAAARAERTDPGRERKARRGRFFARTAALPPLLALLLSLLAAAGPAPPQAAAPAAAPETRRAEWIAPGLERIEIRRGGFGLGLGPDRWVVNVLVLDPSRTRLILGRAGDKGVGTETTSSLARRHRALAAVNAGFFRTSGPYKGEPAGIFISGGKVFSEPYLKRPGLAVINRGDRTRLAVVDAEVRLEAVAGKSARRRIDGVNRPRLDDDLILFTPELGPATLTGPQGIEATVEKGRVTGVAEAAGNAAIPGDGFVLSAHGAAAAWVRANLKPGARVEAKASIAFDPRPVFVPEFVVGGGPRLIRDGRAVRPDPGISNPGFADARHPRTAVGIRADGRILLVTVDGRQPERSVGMTIAELAALMRELRAVEAINMDGGGSTTMVAGDRVVNSPSDFTGERPVGDALLVLPRVNRD